MVSAQWKQLENQEFRAYADEMGVFLWEIAARLGRSEMWLTRRLRVPLNDGEFQLLKQTVDAIATEKKAKQEE